jgi:hypothetical protein
MRTKSIGLMIAISLCLANCGPEGQGRSGSRRGGSGSRLTSRHQPPYALMYEDNPDP